MMVFNEASYSSVTWKKQTHTQALNTFYIISLWTYRAQQGCEESGDEEVA